MTTPANRAPRFVVMDQNHVVSDVTETEDEARACAIRADTHWPDAAPSTIHPIGAALPAPVPVKKTLGQVAYEAAPERAHLVLSMLQSDWEKVASAVIAAHEASVRWSGGSRWAIRDINSGEWWNGEEYGPKKDRATYATPSLAKASSPLLDHRPRAIQPVPTRRRRVAR